MKFMTITGRSNNNPDFWGHVKFRNNCSSRSHIPNDALLCISFLQLGLEKQGLHWIVWAFPEKWGFTVNHRIREAIIQLILPKNLFSRPYFSPRKDCYYQPSHKRVLLPVAVGPKCCFNVRCKLPDIILLAPIGMGWCQVQETHRYGTFFPFLPRK